MKKNSHTLSVVYATYNEEKNIERSLQSIQDIADEIIVVDGSSTDNTATLAKKLGARVISTTNKPIFHINKQMAMDAAQFSWVLQMDADEVIDEEMKAHILRIVKTENKAEVAAGYWLRRKNWFLHGFLTKGGQYPDPVIRFYQRGKAHLPMVTVHEQMEVEGEVGWLEGHLLHYNAPTFSDYLRKANTYTTLTAQELSEEGIEPSFFTAMYYMIWKPKVIFFQLYLRHKGFQDGFPGFVFALFSGLHYLLAYIKLWELKQSSKKAL